MLTRYSTSFYALVDVYVFTAEDFLKAKFQLALKVWTYMTTEQNNILIGPISNFLQDWKIVLDFVPGPSLGA